MPYRFNSPSPRRKAHPRTSSAARLRNGVGGTTRPESKSASSTGAAGTGATSSKTTRSASSRDRFSRLTFQFGRIGKLEHATNLRVAYLDYDRRAIPRLRPIWAVCRIIGVRPLWVESKRTRHGWHVRVCFRNRFTAAELVAFQACCGSDPRREALNLMRVFNMRRSGVRSKFWIDRWNLLFSGKLDA